MNSRNVTTGAESDATGAALTASEHPLRLIHQPDLTPNSSKGGNATTTH